MLDCHVNAFLIVPGRVFGRRLKHLTLAHYWILEAVGSPFPSRRPPNLADAVFASLVCSLPAAVMRWLIRHPRTLAASVRLWTIRAGRFNPLVEIKAFSAYWTAYTAMPDVINKHGERAGADSCLPSSVNIAYAIMGKVGERRAWSMPLPLALAYFVSESERNGREYRTEWQKEVARINAEVEHG